MADPRIEIEPLSASAFADFGQVVTAPSGPPSSSGEGWQCWFGPVELSAPNQVIGQVITTPGDGYLRSMERHCDEEMLIPVSGAVLQAVCQRARRIDDESRPDATTCRVFRIEPGQAIVIAPGVWHAPAYSLEATALYFFTGTKSSEPQSAISNPWIPFANAEIRKIAR